MPLSNLPTQVCCPVRTTILTGLDYAKNGFKVGAGFTYTQNDIESAFGNSRVKSTGGMLYAGYRTNGFSLGVGG